MAQLDYSETSPIDPLFISKDRFKRFSEFIKSELGIKMPQNKISMLRSRLFRRIRTLGMSSIEVYQDFLFSDAGKEERTHFFDIVTTNKTDFLREPEHFDFLMKEGLPSLDPRLNGRRPGNSQWQISGWCAGCSTGEEAYTLSMVLCQYGEAHPSFDYRLFATDISTRVLAHARKAVYDESRIEPVPMDWRKKYLLRSKDRKQALVRFIPNLRARICFDQINFMDSQYDIKSQFEFIFFRNVMIYFDRPTQEAVINKLCRNLKPGGFLFVGHSESLSGLKIPVEQIGNSIFRKL